MSLAGEVRKTRPERTVSVRLLLVLEGGTVQFCQATRPALTQAMGINHMPHGPPFDVRRQKGRWRSLERMAFALLH